MISKQRAHEIFVEVLREEGVILKLNIEPDTTAHMQWGTVTISEEDLRSECWTRSQELHEVGHRSVEYGPGTEVNKRLLMRIAEEEGAQDQHDLVNVVCDALINKRNLDAYPFYEGFLKSLLKMSESSPDPRVQLLRHVTQISLGEKTKDSIAAQVHDLLFNDPRNFYTRFREVAGLLRDLFTYNNQNQFGSAGQPNPLKGQQAQGGQQNQGQDKQQKGDKKKGKGWSGDKKDKQDQQTPVTLSDLVKPLPSKDLDPREVDEYARSAAGAGVGVTPADGEEVYVTYQILKLYEKYVEVTDKMSSGRPGKARYSDAWRIGDSPRELRILDSAQRFGAVLIPGVTTLKRPEGMEAEQQGGAGTVIIIMDTSGSMNDAVNLPNGISTRGLKLQRAKEAAFSIAETARTKGDCVGFIAFCSVVSKSVKPTLDIYGVQREVVRCGANGSTNMSPALLLALEWVHQNPSEKYTFFLITDAELGDLAVAEKYLQELPRYGKVVLFFINDEKEELPDIFKQFKVYWVAPWEEFVEQALLEMT